MIGICLKVVRGVVGFGVRFQGWAGRSGCFWRHFFFFFWGGRGVGLGNRPWDGGTIGDRGPLNNDGVGKNFWDRVRDKNAITRSY